MERAPPARKSTFPQATDSLPVACGFFASPEMNEHDRREPTCIKDRARTMNESSKFEIRDVKRRRHFVK
jgi:hypothetical protein